VIGDRTEAKVYQKAMMPVLALLGLPEKIKIQNL